METASRRVTQDNNFIFLLLFCLDYTPVMDVAFLFGTSPGPLAVERFAAQKKLVKGILNRYEISRQKALVSLILKDDQPVVVLKLGDATNKHEASLAIDSLRNRKRTSSMANLLTFINNTVFSSGNGARQGVPKSILYFVDEKLSEIQNDVKEIAAKLREDNVKLVFVTQGDSVDVDKLKLFVPDEHTIFTEPNLTTLDRSVTPVSAALKPSKFIEPIYCQSDLLLFHVGWP